MNNILSYSKKYSYAFGTLLALFFGFAPMAHGAVLYFESSRTNIGIGDEFSVDLFIDTEGEMVNALETKVVFSDTHLTFVDISSVDSVIDFWIERGRESEGIISLSGVKTNGFLSVIDPFGAEVTTAKIATLVFEGKTVGSSNLVLAGSSVLLNDGLGTPTTTVNGKSVPVSVFSSVAVGSPEVPPDEVDIVKPDLFEVYVEKTPLLPGGKDYLIFQATDDQTDIEFYEVKEGNAGWKRATSPYPLESRRCPLEVFVKAVDSEGNERIVTTIVDCQNENDLRIFIIALFLSFLFLIFVLFLIKRRRKRNE